jgi:SagB-type dehydrogenase family enzyme
VSAIVLGLVAGSAVDRHDDGVTVRGRGAAVSVRRLDRAVVAGLGSLATGVESERLEGLAPDVAGLARVALFLTRLCERGLLVRTVQLGGQPIFTMLPTAAGRALTPSREGSALLSRFAFVRDGVLESPLSRMRVRLDDPRASTLIHDLACGRAAEQPALALLRGARFLADADEGLEGWSFPALLFHARSRQGRHDGEYGGTFRLAGQVPPPPALRPPHPGVQERLALDRADLDRLRREDPPLGTEVSPQPLDRASLGVLLHRAARVTGLRHVTADTPAGPLEMDVALRPYPGGGALHELEIYLLVQRCPGVAPGLYHYDPLAHQLARLGPGHRSREPVLLVVAARFARRAWKYASTAHANTLKNAGVLFQSLHLTAAVMGLRARVVSGVAPGDFARAARLDPFAEACVGQLSLDTAPDGPAPVLPSRPPIPDRRAER